VCRAIYQLGKLADQIQFGSFKDSLVEDDEEVLDYGDEGEEEEDQDPLSDPMQAEEADSSPGS
jgi:hypothetical protein